ncbi:MAG: helix-turn-helix domain-containing protein [Proteobacteria bacterium]|nr:helix-turn-helix domain-containing protein [Pseudomonadota bacterium]
MIRKATLASNACLQTMTDADFFGDKSPGEWLRGIRTELGFTQQELSDVLGYTRVNITLFESGQNPVPHTVKTTMLLMRMMYHQGSLDMRLFVSPPKLHDALIEESISGKT